MNKLDVDALERAITLNDDGVIVVESYFEKEMSLEDMSLLEACIEDNIWDNGDGIERIHYADALRDYCKALKTRNNKIRGVK